MSMLKMNEIIERIRKTNDQRSKMALTLLNVMKQAGQSSLGLRSAVAASMLEMLETSMIEEDKDLIGILNEGINDVCKEAKEEHGIEDYRSQLMQTVKFAQSVLDERIGRMKDGEDILNKVNFNDINLN